MTSSHSHRSYEQSQHLDGEGWYVPTPEGRKGPFSSRRRPRSASPNSSEIRFHTTLDGTDSGVRYWLLPCRAPSRVHQPAVADLDQARWLAIMVFGNVPNTAHARAVCE